MIMRALELVQELKILVMERFSTMELQLGFVVLIVWPKYTLRMKTWSSGQRMGSLWQ